MDNYEKRELISIVVPVYRIRDYLAGCIDSVLAQTYPYWELILVDDGSDDGSERICDDYAKRDPGITVIHQSNQGVSAARNQGVARAKGEYLAFLDADDRIEPQYLDVLYKDMAVQGADLVCCNAWEESQGVRVDYRCVSENRKIEDRESLYPEGTVRLHGLGQAVQNGVGETGGIFRPAFWRRHLLYVPDFQQSAGGLFRQLYRLRLCPARRRRHAEKRRQKYFAAHGSACVHAVLFHGSARNE